MRGRLIAGVTAVAAVLALAGGGVSRAQDACPAPAYPGDAAPKDQIAQWMAYGVALAALPRELPVMASLVESGLNNVQGGDADSVGYFQMRTSIWNQGEYAGYPENPDLQLKWFVDQATAVRRARLAAGLPDPAADENAYGEWIADVQRPPAQFRGRYQLRLADARVLIGVACVPAPLPGASLPIVAPGSTPAPDLTAPELSVAVRTRQRALHRGSLVITLGCPGEPCTASAYATLRVPRARRPPLVFAHTRAIPAGGQRTLRFALRGEARRRLRKALRERGSVAATVRLRVVDAAGNVSAETRTPRIVG